MKLTLVWNGNPLKSKKKVIEKAQSFVDEACLEKMEEFVPVGKPKYENSGKLRDSAEIKEPGLIIYTAPFAKHAYYDDVNHKRSGNPNGKRLWFEVMKQRYKEEILKGAQKILNGR